MGVVRDMRILTRFRKLLPLPSGEKDNVIYREPLTISNHYTAKVQEDARADLSEMIKKDILKPLDNALSIFVGSDVYMTRLYTALSPEEMTKDPSFVFNSMMPGQDLQRNATLKAECKEQGTQWTLTLGEGTGRSDEVVIQGRGQPSRSTISIPQNASWQIAKMFAEADPEVMVERQFTVEKVGRYEAPGSLVQGAPAPVPTPSVSPMPVSSPTPTPESVISTPKPSTVSTNRSRSSGGGSLSWSLFLLLLGGSILKRSQRS